MIAVLLASLAAPAHAGLFGSDAPGRIPVPARVFSAEVEDVGGTVVRIDRVTFDGEVYVFGTLGKAQVTVPFEDIAEILFTPGDDADHRVAECRLRSGESWKVVVETDRPFYGRAAFGNYRLDAADARRVRWISPTEPTAR